MYLIVIQNLTNIGISIVGINEMFRPSDAQLGRRQFPRVHTKRYKHFALFDFPVGIIVGPRRSQYKHLVIEPPVAVADVSYPRQMWVCCNNFVHGIECSGNCSEAVEWFWQMRCYFFVLLVLVILRFDLLFNVSRHYLGCEFLFLLRS